MAATESWTQERILGSCREIIGRIVPGIDKGTLAEIEDSTRLGADLRFSSLHFVKLLGMVRETFALRDLPLHALLLTPEGTVAGDLTVGRLTEVLRAQLSAVSA